MAQVRLTGLGDEEYLWEPVPGCWSIRRRGEAVTPRAFGPGEWVLDLGAADIPASEYAEVARQAAGGMTVAKIAEDWSVSVERVEQVLAHTGDAGARRDAGHDHRVAAGPPALPVRGRMGVDLRRTSAGPEADGRLHPLRRLGTRAVLGGDRPLARRASPPSPTEQLDTVGFSQYPYGSDPDDPFITVLSGANLEFIHHMAEIALLRDLWRARFTASE